MPTAPKRRWRKFQALPSPMEIFSLASIRSGRWTKYVTIAIRKAKPERIMYGIRTEEASCAALALAATKMKAAPIFGARQPAKELAKPQRLRREEAVSGVPSAPT